MYKVGIFYIGSPICHVLSHFGEPDLAAVQEGRGGGRCDRPAADPGSKSGKADPERRRAEGTERGANLGAEVQAAGAGKLPLGSAAGEQ